MNRTNRIFGDGSYGIVYEATNDITDNKKETLAVKCNLVEKDIDFIGNIRELDIISSLHGHPNIALTKYVYFANPFADPTSIKINKKQEKEGYRFDNLFFVLEPAAKNLLGAISEKDQDWSKYKKYILHILCALEYMHHKNIVHQDLKPSNVLLYEDGTAKLCDFGLSEPLTIQQYNKGMITAWYRPPEILLDEKYTFTADIWSVGCICCELSTRIPLLCPVEDKTKKIVPEVIKNIPSLDMNEFITKTKSKEKCKYKDFRDMIVIKDLNTFNSSGGTYDQFIDLIEKMLLVNPEKRFTATQCLNHDFFKCEKEYITNLRNRYKIPDNNTSIYPYIKLHKETYVNIIDCNRRKCVVNEVFTIYNRRISYLWYTHRIMFHSLSLFDIYLNEFYKNEEDKQLEKKDVVETLNTYYICLYICIKYFTILCIPITFKKLTNNKFEKFYVENENFERKFIRDVLNKRVYSPTIYEAMNHKMDETETCKLLMAYGNAKSVNNISLSDFLKVMLN
jgi:serine/threonine protein kinase